MGILRRSSADGREKRGPFADADVGNHGAVCGLKKGEQPEPAGLTRKRASFGRAGRSRGHPERKRCRRHGETLASSSAASYGMAPIDASRARRPWPVASCTSTSDRSSRPPPIHRCDWDPTRDVLRCGCDARDEERRDSQE